MFLKLIRGTFRALAFFTGGIWMMFRIWLASIFLGKDLNRALRIRLRFLKWLMYAMGVDVEYYGEASREPGLYMSNHRTFFDPIPVLRHVWAVPVGMAEVRKWPIIGLGAELSGVVFVDRSTAEARQEARDTINRRLASGYSILIYPEGAIYKGPTLGELKMGMFRDAAEHGYTIHPVAMEYRYASDVWKGKSFVRQFYSRFGRKKVEMRISYGKPLIASSAEQLATACRDWIESEIVRLREGWYINDLEIAD